MATPFQSSYIAHEHAKLGEVTGMWRGSTAVDGAAYPWSAAGLGAQYLYANGSDVRLYCKLGTSNATADWVVIGSTSQVIGNIDFPLTTMRVLGDAGVIPAKLDGGGLLSSDTLPVCRKIDGLTNGSMEIRWSATIVNPITFQFIAPPDFNDAADVTVNLYAAMESTTDTPVFTVDSWWESGATVSDTTAAVTGTSLAMYSATIDAADIPEGAKICTINLTPGAHGTDELYLYAVRIDYTRK